MSFLNMLDKLKPSGANKWNACCPVHDDHNPSMSIKQLDDLSYVCHCHSCGANGMDVFKALGCDLDELFGGKEFERDPISPKMKDDYKSDTYFVKIHEEFKRIGKPTTLSDHKRYKLATARIAGYELKTAAIRGKI